MSLQGSGTTHFKVLERPCEEEARRRGNLTSIKMQIAASGFINDAFKVLECSCAEEVRLCSQKKTNLFVDANS
jgi:hypothetical protein